MSHLPVIRKQSSSHHLETWRGVVGRVYKGGVHDKAGEGYYMCPMMNPNDDNVCDCERCQRE